jgi:hypothetical protein
LDRLKTTSERVDDLPLLISWLKRMHVDVIIDPVLGPPHGNWDGWSYGEVALVFVAYVLMCCTHFLSPMQAWASKRLVSLSQALGKPVREADFTDDRLGVILSRLGDDTTRLGEQIELEVGQHLVRAYELPTEIGQLHLNRWRLKSHLKGVPPTVGPSQTQGRLYADEAPSTEVDDQRARSTGANSIRQQAGQN